MSERFRACVWLVSVWECVELQSNYDVRVHNGSDFLRGGSPVLGFWQIKPRFRFLPGRVTAPWGVDRSDLFEH